MRIAKVICLLLCLSIYGKAQRSYEIGVFAEQKINVLAFDYSGHSKGISGLGMRRGGIGLTFLTYKKKSFKMGLALSYNENYNYYAGAGIYYYGYLLSWKYKNCKLSGIFSTEFKHRFYLSFFGDVCYFTYQHLFGNRDRNAPRNAPYLYESSNPNIFALALSVRFGKQFKIFSHNLLGIHVGVQSPYLYLNWEPVYFKGVNLAGITLGLNYTFGWQKQ